MIATTLQAAILASLSCLLAQCIQTDYVLVSIYFLKAFLLDLT